MALNRLKDPVVVVGVAVFVLLFATWLFPRRQADSHLADVTALLDKTNARLGHLEDQLAKLPTGDPSSSANRLGLMTDESQQFSDAIRLAKEQLETGAFSNAYDLLLVVSRLRPSDPELFELLLTFIETTRDSTSDQAAFLADDLISRGESLIHFQLPKDVASARQRFTQVSQRNATQIEKAESPFSEVLNLLTVAENPGISVPIRTRAADQARSSLGDVLLSRAISDTKDSNKDDSSQIEMMQKRIDSAEQACIADLFLKTKERANDWLTSTQMLLRDSESANADDTPATVSRLRTSTRTGFDLAQELTPYAKSGVSGATDLATQVDEKVTLLQRTKTWLYNQQVLHLIRDIEPRKDLSTKEKIQYLAEVDEEHLSPYILRLHSKLWEKTFEELKSDDEKLWALRLRILRVKE